MKGFLCGQVIKTDSIPLDRIKDYDKIILKKNFKEFIEQWIEDNPDYLCQWIKDNCDIPNNVDTTPPNVTISSPTFVAGGSTEEVVATATDEDPNLTYEWTHNCPGLAVSFSDNKIKNPQVTTVNSSFSEDIMCDLSVKVCDSSNNCTNKTRTIIIPHKINTSANWEYTGVMKCSSSNTVFILKTDPTQDGYAFRERRDTNPDSPTFNTTEWERYITSGADGQCKATATVLSASISQGECEDPNKTGKYTTTTLTLNTSEDLSSTPSGWVKVTGTRYTKVVTTNGTKSVTLNNGYNTVTATVDITCIGQDSGITPFGVDITSPTNTITNSAIEVENCDKEITLVADIKGVYSDVNWTYSSQNSVGSGVGFSDLDMPEIVISPLEFPEGSGKDIYTITVEAIEDVTGKKATKTITVSFANCTPSEIDISDAETNLYKKSGSGQTQVNCPAEFTEEQWAAFDSFEYSYGTGYHDSSDPIEEMKLRVEPMGLIIKSYKVIKDSDDGYTAYFSIPKDELANIGLARFIVRGFTKSGRKLINPKTFSCSITSAYPAPDYGIRKVGETEFYGETFEEPGTDGTVEIFFYSKIQDPRFNYGELTVYRDGVDLDLDVMSSEVSGQGDDTIRFTIPSSALKEGNYTLETAARSDGESDISYHSPNPQYTFTVTKSERAAIINVEAELASPNGLLVNGSIINGTPNKTYDIEIIQQSNNCPLEGKANLTLAGKDYVQDQGTKSTLNTTFTLDSNGKAEFKVDIISCPEASKNSFVSFVFKNEKGDIQHEIFTVKAGDCDNLASKVVLYEFISPNGDGKNDHLDVDGLKEYTENCSGTNVLRIHNRNGALVYEKSNYMLDSERFEGKGNKGSFLGQKLPSGTYTATVEAGSKSWQTGNLTIAY